jgi:hypothetical protein
VGETNERRKKPGLLLPGSQPNSNAIEVSGKFPILFLGSGRYEGNFSHNRKFPGSGTIYFLKE